jgi:hypothetical protein
MNRKPITVFAINMKSRTDRKDFISSQIIDREEFQFYLVEASEHRIGAVGQQLFNCPLNADRGPSFIKMRFTNEGMDEIERKIKEQIID